MTLLDRRSARARVHHKPRTWRDSSWPEPPPIFSTMLEPLAVLYLGYLLIDALYRLLMKTTDVGGILRYRNPGTGYLVVGTVLYLAMTGGEVRVVVFGEYLLEATKVLLLAEGVKAAKKRWYGNWRGVGRSLKRNEGLKKKDERRVEIEKDKSRVGIDNDERRVGTEKEAAEIRRLREERIKALESAAASKKRLKVLHRPKERVPVAVTAGRRLGGS
ncbi:hypothetical protein K440DRAFT_635580 [Wilcoxina mikolae CBS 423.85]|nr:hypothetical protein K440DRAFT_635580 [Wilcoxina mikolae CBS 423.85]